MCSKLALLQRLSSTLVDDPAPVGAPASLLKELEQLDQGHSFGSLQYDDAEVIEQVAQVSVLEHTGFVVFRLARASMLAAVQTRRQRRLESSLVSGLSDGFLKYLDIGRPDAQFIRVSALCAPPHSIVGRQCVAAVAGKHQLSVVHELERELQTTEFATIFVPLCSRECSAVVWARVKRRHCRGAAPCCSFEPNWQAEQLGVFSTERVWKAGEHRIFGTKHRHQA